MEEGYSAKFKPGKCPKCGSKRIARILYGLPIFSDKLQADMKAGKIALGGCCLTGHDPEWICLECEAEIYRA